MRNNRWMTSLAAFVLSASMAAAAAAQDAPRKTGPGDALPGPNANPPGSEMHPADGSNPVQQVPGAMPGSDAVPSTMSEKNAADDKLIIFAYTFKNLSDKERRTIYEALKDRPRGTAFNADVGIELPLSVDLHDVPADVTTQVPQTKGYQYAVSENRVLLVSPATRVVVGSFAESEPLNTTGQGRR